MTREQFLARMRDILDRDLYADGPALLRVLEKSLLPEIDDAGFDNSMHRDSTETEFVRKAVEKLNAGPFTGSSFIQLIKMYREQYGTDLLVTKLAVERILTALQLCICHPKRMLSAGYYGCVIHSPAARPERG